MNWTYDHNHHHSTLLFVCFHYHHHAESPLTFLTLKRPRSITEMPRSRIRMRTSYFSAALGRAGGVEEAPTLLLEQDYPIHPSSILSLPSLALFHSPIRQSSNDSLKSLTLPPPVIPFPNTGKTRSKHGNKSNRHSKLMSQYRDSPPFSLDQLDQTTRDHS